MKTFTSSPSTYTIRMDFQNEDDDIKKKHIPSSSSSSVLLLYQTFYSPPQIARAPPNFFSILYSTLQLEPSSHRNSVVCVHPTISTVRRCYLYINIENPFCSSRIDFFWMTCLDIIRLKLMTNQSNRLHFDIYFIVLYFFLFFQVGCCQSSRSLALPASCFSPCWWVPQPIRRWRVSRYLHNTRQQQQQLKTFLSFSLQKKYTKQTILLYKWRKAPSGSLIIIIIIIALPTVAPAYTTTTTVRIFFKEEEKESPFLSFS